MKEFRALHISHRRQRPRGWKAGGFIGRGLGERVGAGKKYKVYKVYPTPIAYVQLGSQKTGWQMLI